MNAAQASDVPAFVLVRRIERTTRRVLTNFEDDPARARGPELAAQLRELLNEFKAAPDFGTLSEQPPELATELRKLINRAIDMANECIEYLVETTEPRLHERTNEGFVLLEALREYLIEMDHDVLDIVDARAIDAETDKSTVPWDEMKRRLGWQ